MDCISVSDAIIETGMTGGELWAAYFGLGGNLTRSQFADQVGSGLIAGPDRSMLVQALNDWYTERGRNHPVQG